MPLVVNQRITIGYATETLTVANTVQVLTPSIFKDSVTSGGATDAFITLETAEIRYYYDGTQPTSTTGHILAVGQNLVLRGQNQMINFKCIRTGSTSGVITVTYERD